MSSPTDDLRSIMESTLLTFLGHQALNRNVDPSVPASMTTSECLWYIKPDSFMTKYPFVDGVKTSAEQKEHMGQEIKIMEESRNKILDSTIDAVARKGSAHVEHWTKFDGSKPSIMEICWFVNFTDDGKKISKVVKFIDTAEGSKTIEDMARGGYKLEEEAAKKESGQV
ncbi:uncharacterized protein GGS22DRAFT_200062 [Annulohypoxylon maeteangense]|uniref:uncharacterized protein n=1 Tax=Annulohypoxylon maeteangense TaxID=1927788 RepID=UPI00200721AB|nr:uncharacterized protein GGS22DRAFT_200062 [Annulohypoxylon maeteangense]KAI0884962.1 hypothetical protein GGS22DRAFT_200062 [Annulohypoxylon maeteangense]